MKKSNENKGFTLVELLVTISLLTLVAGLCASLIITGLSHLSLNGKKNEFHSGANLFLISVDSNILDAKGGVARLKWTDDDKNYRYVYDKSTGAYEDCLCAKIVNTETGKLSVFFYCKNDKALYLATGTAEGGVTSEAKICPYVSYCVVSFDSNYKLLTIRIQCSLDDSWLSSSFYVDLFASST